MLPGSIGDQMEGCPESNNLLYLILASLLVPFLFVLYKVCAYLYKKGHHDKVQSTRRESMKSYAFAELQLELFGEKALRNLKHIGSSHDLMKLASSMSLGGSQLELTKKETVDDMSSNAGSDNFDSFMSYLNDDDVPQV